MSRGTPSTPPNKKRKEHNAHPCVVKHKRPRGVGETEESCFNEIGPPGLLYCKHFLDAQQEKELIENIDRQEWNTALRRRTQHYGIEYDYKRRTKVDSSEIQPLPPWLDQHVEKLSWLQDAGGKTISSQAPQQCIVNEYRPGQGISAHVDAKCFGDPVISISLGSPCVMVLRRGTERFDLYLQRRSCVVLSGQSRWDWTHEIPARCADIHEEAGGKVSRGRRLSLTFRRMSE